MASSVYYKFRSQRDESKVTFDGTGISVFDLKREIILANNLKANDFDLLLLDPSTNQGASSFDSVHCSRVLIFLSASGCLYIKKNIKMILR